MAGFGVELILVLFSLFMLLGTIITYITAIQDGHVSFPGLPYISDTGSFPPESCVFTFVLTSAAIIAFVIIWIRYRHVKAHYADSPVRVHLINIVSFIFGFLSMLGLVIVASFQNVNVPSVHFTGAVMIFLGGVMYTCFQSRLSHRLRGAHPQHVSRCVLSLRIVFCSLLSLFAVSAAVTGLAAWHYRSRQEHRNYGGPTDIGFILHVLSACSEYLGGFFYILFFLTFHPDFQRIHVDLHIRSRHHHGDIDGQAVINENTPLNY